MAAAAASEEEEICGRKINQESCSRKFGTWSCKNASADNELGYCEKHYKDYKDLELEKKKLPSDEQRCSKLSGMGWRCKNFRMRSHGGTAANDDSVRNSKFCEKHYNYFAEYGKKRKKKKKRGDDDTSDIEGGPANVGTKRNKKQPPDELRCGMTGGGGWRCKNVRMGHGAGAADDDTLPKTRYCEKHYNYYANLKKKRSEGAGSGPDEQRCSKMNGMGWRCKNFRMGHGAADDDDTVLKTRYCEKHYYNLHAKYSENLKKKVLEEGNEQRCCLTGSGGWRCKNFRMGHDAAVDDDTFPKTTYCEKHYNLKKKVQERCCQTDGKIWRCKNFRMGHGDDDSVPKSRYCEKHYKSRYYQNHLKKRNGDGEAAGCSATGPTGSRGLKRRRKKVPEEDTWSLDVTETMQPATAVTIVEEGGIGNIRRKRKNVERAEDERFVDDILGKSEDCDSCLDSENSVGDLMDMLGMENWNWNEDGMKWNSEADMLSCFERDPVLSYL